MRVYKRSRFCRQTDTQTHRQANSQEDLNYLFYVKNAHTTAGEFYEQNADMTPTCLFAYVADITIVGTSTAKKDALGLQGTLPHDPRSPLAWPGGWPWVSS